MDDPTFTGGSPSHRWCDRGSNLIRVSKSIPALSDVTARPCPLGPRDQTKEGSLTCRPLFPSAQRRGGEATRDGPVVQARLGWYDWWPRPRKVTDGVLAGCLLQGRVRPVSLLLESFGTRPRARSGRWSRRARRSSVQGATAAVAS